MQLSSLLRQLLRSVEIQPRIIGSQLITSLRSFNFIFDSDSGCSITLFLSFLYIFAKFARLHFCNFFFRGKQIYCIFFAVLIASAFDVAILGKDLNLDFSQQKGVSKSSSKSDDLRNVPATPASFCNSQPSKNSPTCSVNVLLTLMCFVTCSCIFFASLFYSEDLNTHTVLRLYFLIFSFFGVFISNSTSSTHTAKSANFMNFMSSSTLDCNNTINTVNSTQTRFKIYFVFLFLGSLYIGEILCRDNANHRHTHQTVLFNSSTQSSESRAHETQCDVQKQSLTFYVILIGISAHIILLKTPKQRCYVILNAYLLLASSCLATCFALFANGQTVLSIMHCFIILFTFVLFSLNFL